MSDAPSWKREEDVETEDEEEEVDETGYKTVKDAVLFAIDVSKSMLTPPPPSESGKADKDTPTSAALKCAYMLMQQRIISNPNDMMGILLFGTEQSKFQDDDVNGGGLAYPHCYLLADLDVPAAADVKRLKTLVEDGDEAAKLLVPSSEPVAMSNVLFCANQIFTTRAPNFTSRRLFLVTDNDEPHGKDKALRNSAAVRAKDLYDLGVIIELFPISRYNSSFDRAKFYDDIVYRAVPTDPDAPVPTVSAAKTASSGDGISLLQSLLSSINSKAAAKRALFSNLPLEIGPGLKISVKGYIIIKRQVPVRSCYVWLEGEKPQIAVGTSAYMAEDTARAVEKAEIKKAYKFGGETVTFTKEEITTLRNFGEPGIRIIGFKPLNMLPIWANLKPATFIYPSEEDYVGSTRVFSALQQKLVASQKFGVVWYIARKNAAPVLAALIPAAEELDEDGSQTMPAGLWISPLPFADDIRQNPDTSLVRAEDSLIDMMRIIIQQLQLPKAVYEPRKYPNPSLQWFYRILQALALEEDLPEKPDDKTIPKYRQIDKRAGAYVLDWGTELEKRFEAWQLSNSGRSLTTGSNHKRPAASKAKDVDDAPASKKIKTSDSQSASGDGEMKKLYEQNKIEKLTVVDLKEWLHSKHLSTSGKKTDLVARVSEYFDSK